MPGPIAVFVPPIERSVIVDERTQAGFVLEFVHNGDTTSFECIAQKGGLITGCRLNGVNVLLDDPDPSALDGSTFWPSPQRDWGWPPPHSIDGASYAVTANEATMSVTLVSEVDDSLGVQVVKRFTLDLVRAAIVLEYSLVNAADEVRSFAPWEISRVPAGGVTLFPTGIGVPTFGDFLPLPVTEAGGVTWFEHAPECIRGQHKLFADAARGWLAHTHSNVVFVKSFDDHAPDSSAPGEAQIEIFATPEYEEVEQQGAYAPIAPGQARAWTVAWLVRRMPAGATARPGDSSLVEFIEELA